MSLLDWTLIVNQAIAAVIVLWPIEVTIVWLVWNVRISVKKSGAWMNIMPDLERISQENDFTPEEVREAITILTVRSIKNEVDLMRKHKLEATVYA